MLPPSANAFVGVGSNLGDRPRAIAEAAARLLGAGFGPFRTSRMFETEPVGGPPQGWFLNAVFGGETSLSPSELLGACLEIEEAMGRRRSVANGPRIIDLDVLLYGELVLDEAGLTLPHPRLHLRRFVLAPLADIAPDLVHPKLRLRVVELLARCADSSVVRAVDADGEPA